MEHDAADHLHVVVPLAKGALGRLAHEGERLRQEIVERLAFAQALAELLRLRRHLLVGELLKLRLERVYLRLDQGAELLDLALVPVEERFQETHGGIPRPLF